MEFYRTARVVCRPILKTAFRPWVEGLEHVPREGPAIIACNHLSFSDSVLLPIVMPRTVTFLAKNEYFVGRGIKGKLSAAFFGGVSVPVDRSGLRGATQAAIDAGIEVLRGGNLFGIYPEGTRSPDGRLYRGHTGIAQLVLATGAPVIPVALFNTDRIQPPGTRLPRLHRVGVRVGAPLDFSRSAAIANRSRQRRAMTDEVMAAIQALSGQEYRDVYASTIKEAA